MDISEQRRKRAEAQRRWRTKHPETARAAWRSWRANNKEAKRRSEAAWRKKNPHIVRAISRRSHLKADFGMTEEQYGGLFEQQNGVCYICLKRPDVKSLFVDHCHDSGRIRGLLCNRCNFGMAIFRSKDQLQRAVAYWDRDTGLRVPTRRPRGGENV